MLPNDPDLVEKQWNMYQINAIPSWLHQEGSQSVTVAVIDSGIDYNHPDLKDNMWVNEQEYNGIPGVDDDGKEMGRTLYFEFFYEQINEQDMF